MWLFLHIYTQYFLILLSDYYFLVNILSFQLLFLLFHLETLKNMTNSLFLKFLNMSSIRVPESPEQPLTANRGFRGFVNDQYDLTPDHESPQNLRSLPEDKFPIPREFSPNISPPIPYSNPLQSSPFQPISSSVPELQSVDALHLSIERTQKAIFYMCGIHVVSIVFFAEISCLVRRVCHTNADIDIAPYAAHAFLPLEVIALVLALAIYETARFVYRDYMRSLKWAGLGWAAIMIIYSIAEFVAGMVMSEDKDRETTWNSLTPLGKEYYDEDQDKLAEDYRANMAMVTVFQIASAVILAAMSIALWVLHNKAPVGYLPKPKIRRRAQPLAQEEKLEEENDQEDQVKIKQPEMGRSFPGRFE